MDSTISPLIDSIVLLEWCVAAHVQHGTFVKAERTWTHQEVEHMCSFIVSQRPQYFLFSQHKIKLNGNFCTNIDTMHSHRFIHFFYQSPDECAFHNLKATAIFWVERTKIALTQHIPSSVSSWITKILLLIYYFYMNFSYFFSLFLFFAYQFFFATNYRAIELHWINNQNEKRNATPEWSTVNGIRASFTA